VQYGNPLCVWAIFPNGNLGCVNLRTRPKESLTTEYSNDQIAAIRNTMLNSDRDLFTSDTLRKVELDNAEPASCDDEREANDYDLWWKPVEEVIMQTQSSDNVPIVGAGSQKLVLIPDERAWKIRFAALRRNDGTYPIENFTMSLAPSAGVLLLGLASEKRDSTTITTDNNKVTIIGNPDSGGALPNLPFAEVECRKVQQQLEGFTSTTLTGTAAHKMAILEQLKSCSILHIATHATDENPYGKLPGSMYVGRVRTGEASKHEDRLTSDEIQTLDLRNVELVFLNCCYSGAGTTNAEGIFGLGRAFVLAGAKQIVVSSLPVPDIADIVEFVGVFYESYRANRTADCSLRAAQMWAMDKLSDEVWGSFYTLCSN
jgi:CHAT domain-containing protein